MPVIVTIRSLSWHHCASLSVLAVANCSLSPMNWRTLFEDIKAFVAAGAIDMMQIKTPDLGGLQHSVEAVLACKEAGVAAPVGGSCTETEIAAKASVHLALACGADQLLAKPGMGVDEGFSLVVNEMNRTLALTAGGN